MTTRGDSTERTRAVVAELRAQGLSVRAISERTSTPRSTVADHVAAFRVGGPARVTGRDGRSYPAVWAPAEVGPVPGPDRDRSRSIDRELARILLLNHVRQARRLVPDAVPLSDDDRARLARDLRAIARRAGLQVATTMGGTASGPMGVPRDGPATTATPDT